jgi:hypothetical protein
LRERIGPALCAHLAPCRVMVATELSVYPDREERSGTPPPPLCVTCPQREDRRRPVRWIEVVKHYCGLRGDEAGEIAPNGAKTPSVGSDGAER